MTIEDTTRQTHDMWVATNDLKIAQASLAHVREELQKSQADFENVAAALLTEAQERDWCDEYNNFVTNTNKLLKVSALRKYVNEFEATITLTVKFNCNEDESDEHARNIAVALYDHCDNTGGVSFEITDHDYSNVDAI